VRITLKRLMKPNSKSSTVIGGAMNSSDFEGVLDELQALGVACGLHTKREKRLLWDLASTVASGVIVEIGSFEGYSTIILAKAAGKGNVDEVYAIDPHTGRSCEVDGEDSPYEGDTWPRFNENIRRAGVSHVVRGLKLKSEEAVEGWEKSIGLLWIDGSHRYEDVKKDFLLWRRHLVAGGVVVFHDMWNLAVSKVIADHVLPDRTVGEFRFVPCCAFCATYLGDRHGQVLRRTRFRLALALRRAIRVKQPFRGHVKRVLRWLSHIWARG
jgi:predicted O-methyltransferase YrrM